MEEHALDARISVISLEQEAALAAAKEIHDREIQGMMGQREMRLQEERGKVDLAKSVMDLLGQNPSALYAIQRLPGFEGLANLLGIGRIEDGSAPATGTGQGLVPTLGSLSELGTQGLQQAQTTAGITEGIVPDDFMRRSAGVTPVGQGNIASPYRSLIQIPQGGRQ